MTTARLLADLHALGVTLAVDGDRLRFCPRGKVTPELLQRLQTHKVELLGMLQPGDNGDGDETHASTGETGVVSPAVPQDPYRHGDGDALQAQRRAHGADGPHGDRGDALQAHGGADGPQALPGGDPLGADGCPNMAGDWTEYTTPDDRRGWVRADAAGLEYHNLPNAIGQRLMDEARRLRARCPVPDAKLQPKPVPTVRTWPPVVPDAIKADPIPTCSGCGRLRSVVPGQPGRPAGLCFGCWILSRKRS